MTWRYREPGHQQPWYWPSYPGVSEWLSLTAFWDSGHQDPCSPYKPCNYSLYIRIIIFPHIDILEYSTFKHYTYPVSQQHSFDLLSGVFHGLPGDHQSCPVIQWCLHIGGGAYRDWGHKQHNEFIHCGWDKMAEELYHWGLAKPYGDIDMGKHWLR